MKEPASKLRGYIANRFKEYPILHHHIEESYLYTYARVQYKTIEGTAMCKGLDYVVTRKLYVHSRLDGEKEEFKGVPVIGFTGEFRVNFRIPEFFGLGKGVSQGFGVVRQISKIA